MIQVIEDGRALPPEDYVVLRKHDLFAAPAVWGYLHLIQSALELDTMQGRRVFTRSERSALGRLCDLLEERASAWARLRADNIPGDTS